MKKTKFVAVAAAALMAATTIGTLAGCADKSHTIRVYLLTNSMEREVYTEYFKDLETKINEELEEQGLEGYKIEFSGDEVDTYYEKLDGDITQHATPDVFYLRPNEILQYKKSIVSVQSYVDANTGLLDGVYKKAIDMYRYDPSTGRLGNPEDELYAFPKDLSTQQLGYNRTLLEAYEQVITQLPAHFTGGKMKMPWDLGANETYTWNEYLEINKTIAGRQDLKPEGVKGNVIGCDIPDIEILAHSFAVAEGIENYSLVDLSDGRANGKVASIDKDSPLYKAIEYQAKLAASGGADHASAKYSDFTGGNVCFYGAVGSWEVADYNDKIGDGKWEVMPWPTVNGDANWYGLIKSAGYVISADCAKYPEKADIAMRIASSFLSPETQDLLVRVKQITIPILSEVQEDYLDPTRTEYKPASRKIFIDVISGEHGFFPATYSTYNTVWLDQLTNKLADMWVAGGKGSAAQTFFNNTDWNDIHSQMQKQYDNDKNK